MSDEKRIFEQWWTDDGGKTKVVVNYDMDGATRVVRGEMQILLEKSGYEMVRENSSLHRSAINA